MPDERTPDERCPGFSSKLYHSFTRAMITCRLTWSSWLGWASETRIQRIVSPPKISTHVVYFACMYEPAFVLGTRRWLARRGNEPGQPRLPPHRRERLDAPNKHLWRRVDPPRLSSECCCMFVRYNNYLPSSGSWTSRPQ